jgi:hypothetical protein
MKLEHIFEGTPEQFYEFVSVFQVERTSGDNNDPFFWIPDIDRIRDKSHQIVYLWDSRRNQRTLSFIKIQTAPYGKSRLIINIPESSEDIFLQWWEFLRDEIERQKGLALGKRGKEPSVKSMKPWRERRANLFRKVKDDNPSLTYDEVAVKATDKAMSEIGKQVSAIYPSREEAFIDAETNRIFREEWANHKGEFIKEDVKNDYKAMGWEWEDSRKIR